MVWIIVLVIAIILISSVWFLDRRHHGHVDAGRLRDSMERLQNSNTPGSRRNNWFNNG